MEDLRYPSDHHPGAAADPCPLAEGKPSAIHSPEFNVGFLQRRGCCVGDSKGVRSIAEL